MGVPWSVGFGPKLETRNSGQARKWMACKSLRIDRLVHKENLKEKGIKKYGREQKGKKCQEAKNEEAGRKCVTYRNEKRKGLGRIRKRIWAKTFVKHSKEKQHSTGVCKNIMQQCDRVDLRAAIRSQRGWASVSQSLSNFMLQREWGNSGHLIFHPTKSGWHPAAWNFPCCRHLFLELVTP